MLIWGWPDPPLEGLTRPHGPPNHHHQLLDAKPLSHQFMLSFYVVLNPDLHWEQSCLIQISLFSLHWWVCAACIDGARQALKACCSWAKTDAESLSAVVTLHGSSYSLILGTIPSQSGCLVTCNVWSHEMSCHTWSKAWCLDDKSIVKEPCVILYRLQQCLKWDAKLTSGCICMLVFCPLQRLQGFLAILVQCCVYVLGCRAPNDV